MQAIDEEPGVTAERWQAWKEKGRKSDRDVARRARLAAAVVLSLAAIGLAAAYVLKTGV